jgi:hypothetical protein
MTQPARPFQTGRRIFGRAQDDPIHDPYQLRHKPHEPTFCPGCGAIYHHGRWQWGVAPPDAAEERCPACHRIADDLPAGIVSALGSFALDHAGEILALARNEEAAEKAEHPLNRIMAIKNVDDGIEIRTTDIHLPHRFATALQRAFRGELTTHFDEAGYFVRIDWRRSN